MMNEIAIASMRMSAQQISTQYAMGMQKRVMNDMEQQAMSELEMLPPTPGTGDYIDTYA